VGHSEAPRQKLNPCTPGKRLWGKEKRGFLAFLEREGTLTQEYTIQKYEQCGDIGEVIGLLRQEDPPSRERGGRGAR